MREPLNLNLRFHNCIVCLFFFTLHQNCTMKIILIGSGGREHAIAWNLSKSEKLEKLWIIPGNAGTSLVGSNVEMDQSDFKAIGKFASENHCDMVIVGPEIPLAAGIADHFAKDELLKDIPVIGPAKDGARLESSKDFAKAFMKRHSIPTASYDTFHYGSINEAHEFLETLSAPYVLKADGLAAGKGVLICNTIEEAKEELSAMLVHSRFGPAGRKVVIEEFLKGTEMSVFVAFDGKNWKLLPEAKDYKRVGEGDTGPNTGGMGSISPVPFATPDLMQKVTQRIIEPTINGIISENINYKGFIFIGLMITDADPFVIEYNCRLGDPETEAIIPRLKTNMLDICQAIANQKLDELEIETDDQDCASVMLVSGGYPDDFLRGCHIEGLDYVKGSIVFHAGTKKDNLTGQILTSGGRVMAISTLADNRAKALSISLKNAEIISFTNKYYRKDIGKI